MANQKINGEIHDWSDIKLLVAGKEFKGVTAVSWTEKQDKAHQHGMGAAPLGVGYGNKECECTFKMTHKDAARFQSVAHAAGKTSLDYAPFPIIVTYRDKIDSGGNIDWTPEQVVTLNNVSVNNVSNAHDQGSQKLEVEFSAVCDLPIYSPVLD